MAGEWDEVERESSAFARKAAIVGVAVALAIYAFIHFSAVEPQLSAVGSATTQVGRTSLPPTVIGPSIEDAPAGVPVLPAAAGRESYVGVYECTVNGQRVVSDRPCGSGAQARTLVVEHPDPADAARVQQQTWRQQASPGYASSVQSSSRTASGDAAGAAANEVGHEVQCAQIDQEIDQINARMRRGGYGTEEGNFLRARWHKLKDQRFELGCGR